MPRNKLPASRGGSSLDYAWDEPSFEHTLLVRVRGPLFLSPRPACGKHLRGP